MISFSNILYDPWTCWVPNVAGVNDYIDNSIQEEVKNSNYDFIVVFVGVYKGGEDI